MLLKGTMLFCGGLAIGSFATVILISMMIKTKLRETAATKAKKEKAIKYKCKYNVKACDGACCSSTCDSKSECNYLCGDNPETCGQSIKIYE